MIKHIMQLYNLVLFSTFLHSHKATISKYFQKRKTFLMKACRSDQSKIAIHWLAAESFAETLHMRIHLFGLDFRGES